MYGIIAHFDRETEEYIKTIWKELSELSISSYAEEVRNRRPHLTLASYNALDEEKFIRRFTDFYESEFELPVEMGSLGTFMNSGLLFLAPTPSIELLEFHDRYHRSFADFADLSDSLYLPNKWVPHCTLANRLSLGKLKEALVYCSQRMGKIQAKICEVSIIKMVDRMTVPTIHTCYLKEERR
ncbi:2'-5' RNA ligase family protein [Heyndrickxia sp. FSL W8-0423]|uniref:2'-5' RNA ligase family protein n=1 Tax=Heyndrickxia sp. FSL W8-0423 TaxID=2921601 RepID=UPI0030FBD26D